MTADTKVQGILAGVIELSGPSFLDQIPGSLFGRLVASTYGYLFDCHRREALYLAMGT